MIKSNLETYFFLNASRLWMTIGFCITSLSNVFYRKDFKLNTVNFKLVINNLVLVSI